MNKKTLRNVFIGVATCIVLYWILHETERLKSVLGVLKGIFSPFILGAAMAFILNVPMRAIEGWFKGIKQEKLRRLLSIVLTLIAVLLVLALVFVLLIPQVVQTIQTLIPKLQTFFLNMEGSAMAFLNDNPQLMQWVMQNTDFTSFDWAGLVQKFVTIAGNSLTAILGSAFSAVGILAGAVVEVIIAIVFALYCLFQKETLARQGRKLLYAFLPEKTSDNIIRILRLSNSTFSNFLSGQCVEVCILGCMFAICMAIFRMPYIPLVSVLVAVTAFIPVVGAFVGCAIGAFLMLVNDPLQAVAFVGMFLVIQQIEGNMIYPRVVGNSIGLSGMWVLLAVAVGGELFGVAGMFLMIPVASVLYTLLRERTQLRLDKRPVDPEKLKPQPPELKSQFKEKRKENKEKRAKKNQNKTSEQEQ